MSKKIQLPNKYRTKKTTEVQEKIIAAIREEKKLKTYLEAKNEYFEHQATWDRLEPVVTAEIKHRKETESGTMLDTETGAEYTKKGDLLKVPVREVMTIEKTKLGITMVISKEECKKLGLSLDMKTRDAIKELKKRIGIEGE